MIIIILCMTSCMRKDETEKQGTQPVLDSTFVCDRFGFSVKYPSEWDSLKDQGEGIDVPDAGITVLFENKENQYVLIYGMKWDVSLSQFEDVEKEEYTTGKGLVTDFYELHYDEDIVQSYVFGERKNFAIYVSMSKEMYSRYENTIKSIIDSFEIL